MGEFGVGMPLLGALDPFDSPAHGRTRHAVVDDCDRLVGGVHSAHV